jgi:hypothetical protein
MMPIAQSLSRAATGVPSTRLLTGLLAVCTALALSACGGGGGGGGGSSTTPTSGTGGGTTAPAATATISPSVTSASAGQPVTLTWSSQNATSCTGTGGLTGTLATSGTQQVVIPASGAAATMNYGVTCGTATATAAVAVAANAVQMALDNGPQGAGGAINIPYVSLTICQPGSTTNCQTIDHIMVDSGSYGVRLIASDKTAALALPAMKTAAGALVGECGQFVSGYTWGSIAKGDVKVSGETAANQSIQVIGDAAAGAVPADCKNVGTDIGSLKALGANGVLGIGLFKQDCGAACVQAPVTATYYACTNGSCTPTTMPLAQQVSNPIASFATDNNGVMISFPQVATGGSSTLAGTLVFGIGTNANNGLGTATKYTTSKDTMGNDTGFITTVYKGTTLTHSFLDTGSNGLFFNDSSLTKCTTSTSFYCPATPQNLNATITGAEGSTAPIAFTIESVDGLPDSATAGWIGGPNGGSSTTNQTFDWGLPFFFGRKVFIGMEGANTHPYWAF